jgi:hypothetical protein
MSGHDGLREHVHDLLAAVAFLRSVVASGEHLNADDEARLREVYESARAALAEPVQNMGMPGPRQERMAADVWFRLQGRE